MADLEIDYRNILEEEYTLRRSKNSRYSRNSFARFLGIDSTYLSKLSSGKILLSLDVADKISKKLKLDPARRILFLKSAAEEQQCHALYLLDPALTECDPGKEKINHLPQSRKKKA